MSSLGEGVRDIGFCGAECIERVVRGIHRKAVFRQCPGTLTGGVESPPQIDEGPDARPRGLVVAQ